VTLLILAAALSALLQWPALSLLRALSLVDSPNHRSSHDQPTLRGGGLAVVVALVAVAAISSLTDSLTVVLAALLCFAAIGFADDRAGLSVRWRLVGQVSVGLVSCSALLLLSGRSISPMSISLLMIAVVSFVWYVNAFNFMDGVNSMSGLNAVLAGLYFLWLGDVFSHGTIAAVGGAVAGASLGFLPWNAPRARVFLGDVGSYALGSAIALLAIWSIMIGISPFLCVAPLIIYVADTTYTLIDRLLRHCSWREAHRDHVYQRLTDCGLSHIASSLVVTGSSALICLSAAILVRGGSRWPWVAATLLISVIYASSPRWVARLLPRRPMYASAEVHIEA
jgi:UDP-GlcNAc:undecaprenyl-phosphate GlcNAc-1-phosphate transferase